MLFRSVFHSTEQTFALLRSDCLIDIERHDRWIIMTSPRWVVAVEIPPTFGKRQFTYSWGSPWALFGAGPTTSEWRPVAHTPHTQLQPPTAFTLLTRSTPDLEFSPMHKSIVYVGVTT